MTNYNDRFSIINKKILQPLNRFDIQMIRRLIEQEHIRFLQQQFGEFDTHSPSTAEITRLALEISSGES